MTTLNDILWPDAREPERQVRAHEEGTVISVDGSGVRFTLDSFPSSTGFGPAPYSRWSDGPALTDVLEHTHAMTGPQPGDKCLVAFAGPGISRPWVVGWWGG